MTIRNRLYLSALATAVLSGGIMTNAYAVNPALCSGTPMPTCQSCICDIDTPPTRGTPATYGWTNCTRITTGSCSPITPRPGAGYTPPSTTSTPSRNTISRTYNSKTNSKLTVNYPTTTTDTTPINDFNYTSFPNCPLDPNNYTTTQVANISTTQGMIPLRQDINDNMPTSTSSIDSNYYYTTSGGKPVAPPDQCVVRSRVMCGAAPCTSTSQTITSAIAAVCPDGYVQVGAFDMQPEVAYNPAPASMPFPIPDMATFNSYKAKGYTCNIDHWYTFTYCIYSVNVPSTTIFGSFNINVDQLVPETMSFTDNQGNPTRGVGRYQQISSDYVCRFGRGCGGALDGCSISKTGDCKDQTPGSSSQYMACTNNGVSFSQNYNISYGLYTCTPKAGAYFTNNMAPRALVCARIKATHGPVNK